MIVQKYDLAVQAVNHVCLPEGSQILTCIFLHGKLYLYAAVSVENTAQVSREIRIFGTNEAIDTHELEYIATLADSGIVLHIFERVKGQ